MRRAVIIGMTLLAMGGVQSAPASAKTNACRNASAKQWLKTFGPVLQTLRSGQYYAFRQKGGSWTFCDSKRKGRSRFKSFSFTGTTTGVKLLSRPGKCVALQLNPATGSPPIVPTVDMQPKETRGGSTLNWVERGAPGSRFVKVELSSTCLLGIAYLGASGSRGILLTPVIVSGPIETIPLSASATDEDLKALRLSGNDATWTDAGEKKSETWAP